MAYAERLSRTRASLLRECGPGAQPGFGVTQPDRLASRSIAPELSEHAPPLLPAPDAQSNCIDLRLIARSCPKPRKLHIDCVISPPKPRALKAVELHIDCVIPPPNSRALKAVELNIDCLISSPKSRVLKAVKMHIDCLISSPKSRAPQAAELHINCVISLPASALPRLPHSRRQSPPTGPVGAGLVPALPRLPHSRRQSPQRSCRGRPCACPVPPQSTDHRKARPATCPAPLQEPLNSSSRRRHNLPTPNPGCTPKDQSIEAAKKT